MDGRFVDEKNGAVEAPSMFLPQPPSSVNTHPAWMSSESSRMRKRQRFRRAAIFTTGGLMVIYLLLCSWIAYERTNYGDASLEGDFPHGKFPWPFPRHPPKRPHPHPPPHHPHHPFPHPVPNVLGCKAIPTPSDESSATVKLDVTIPKWRPVAFSGAFLRGNISIAKIPEEAKEEVVEMENWMEEDLSEGKEVKVHITVVNRTEPKFPPHPPHHRRGEAEETEEGDDGDEESEDKGFLLCAVSFSFPHHPPPPDFEGPADGDVLVHPPPPHPHRRPPPPVDIGIFPAYNETYPKFPFPGPPGHPPHSLPPHHFQMTDFEGTSYGSHRSTFKGALRSIVSFLFPMFSSSSEQGQFPQHHHHHHHHHHPPGPPRSGHKCPHGRRRHFPPPPPFEVVALEASVPASVHVIYGLLPPPLFFHPHPPHHPPHEHPLQSFAPISD